MGEGEVQEDERTPFPVSLVVPVLNERSSIDRLLQSIAQQSMPPDEVIIVDGGSDDGTDDLVRQWSDRRVRLVEAGPATPGRGRNVGIEAARNDWIALTDAGIELDAHWLERLVRVAASNPQADVVYGAVEPRHGNRFERWADLAYVPGLAESDVGPVRTEATPSSLLRRSAWTRAGGFPDLRAAEDMIFKRRLKETGAVAAIAAEARVTWELAPTPWRTFQRFRSYSKHNVLAGEEASWHHGVARQWVVGALALTLAGMTRRPWIALGLLAAGVARTATTLARRREGRSWWWVGRPMQFVGVSAIRLILDLATLTGWVEGACERRRLRGRPAR